VAHTATPFVQNVASMPVATLPTVKPLPQVPARPDPVLAWFAHNTLIKIGSFLFFLGAVWFVSYAISEEWISPLMRILLGILVGMGVCALGFWRKLASVDHYVMLTALGVSIIVASVYAGQFVFSLSLFSPLFALLLIILSIGYAVFVSVTTKKEWLCVVSVVASFLAPLLVNAPEIDQTYFLSYLFAVSVGFLAVVFWTHWRSVTLTLVLGSLFWLFAAQGSGIEDTLLWIFVLLFSVLFFSASTVSMMRSNAIAALDLLSLSIVSGSMVWWVDSLTENEAPLLYLFACIVALVGWLCHVTERSEKVVAVYVGLASVLILIATSFAFDGFALTIMYTLEVAASILLAMYLKLSNRAMRLVGGLFVLPVWVSFSDIFAYSWTESALHPSAYALYILTATTLAISAFSLIAARRDTNETLRSIGIVFLKLSWVYAHIAAWLVCGALFEGSTVAVMRYVSWTCISLFTVWYVVAMRLSARALYVSLFGFALPVVTAFLSLDMRAEHWWSVSSLGIYFMTATTIAMGAWLTRRGLVEKESGALTAGAIAVGTGWLYALASIAVFWSTIDLSSNTAYVLPYVSWALLSVLLIGFVRMLRAPFFWTVTSYFSFGVPILASFQSFFSSEWDSSFLHPNALGLYAITGIFLFMGVASLRLAKLATDEKETMFAAAQTFFILAGLYLVWMVWLVAGAIFDSADTAVSVALLVYTVSGLCLYRVGRVQKIDGLRYAGIVLLSGVVLRLLIIDVWSMEVFGRIVTFLGVGLLFIVTALFEKPFEKSK